ncbi:MAG TPA: putative peptidoglycan glycosyltransferase FtsW [Aggregatilinea sp.]|jgi:cell division protein FtsW|uniref:FtsW/RodA/SpoVE family cell cycle protein n=1 Tax=Aggregatilinea sp. TaxID=2806333 RepID=UPI002C0E225A|nr:putative peptidoglycan glycosyltransferase FtsW [Aggregatilinea sp.]HML22970.1 putative peptidoglycan glycosyltransferase FtsW [Aggregatilinea sp.]
MSDPALPEYIEEDGDFNYSDAFKKPPRKPPAPPIDPQRVAERRRLFAAGYDLYLILVVGVLCAVGLIMVYSASIDVSYQVTGNPDETTYFFIRQVRSMAIGALALFLLARLDYHFWRRISVVMMFGVILLLVAVLRFGDTRFEAQRSLIRGSIQPGEIAKFTVVIYMAAWLASKRSKIKQITYGLLPFSVLVGTVAFLIVLQPDLSTAASILATALSMFFIAGADWVQLGVIGGAMGLVGWQLITHIDYASQRIDAHLNAVSDLTQASSHVQQAVTAFLNGGLMGVGLGESKMKFSNNLPFPHTDSIFAIIGEETGLIGSFFVIALFVILIYRGFTVARYAPDTFGGLLAAGVTCWIAYDALLNIAVMTALVPPTGVPLPFISYGGSSLVAAMAGVGLMLNVSRAAAKQSVPKRRQTPSVGALDEDWRDSREDHDLSRGNRGRRIPRVSSRRGTP